ncbi:MAG: nuclear transport factor 2 family protein [Bacteroidota bacterium]
MRYLPPFCLVLLIMACNTQTEPSPVYAQIAETYFQHAFDQDYKGLAALFSEDLQFIGPKVADTLSHQELLDTWRAFHITYDTAYYQKTAHVTLHQEADPEVLYYYQSRFHNRDLGVWVSFPVHVRFRFRDQQIHRMQIYVNQADIQEQLGLGYRLKVEPHPATDSPPSDAYPQGE